MDWSSLGQTIASAAPALGTALGGPAGGAVGGLIASAFGADPNDPEDVAAKVQADPEMAAKLQKIEHDHQERVQELILQGEAQRLEAETARHRQVNKTFRAETGAEDAYVRRWRPTFGYVVAAAWGLQVVGIVAATLYAIVASPSEAGKIINAVGGMAGALATQWSVALAVLGVNVSNRSKDKQVAAGQKPEGVLDKLKGMLGKGGEV